MLGVTPGWLLGEEEAAPYEADEGEHLEARETVPIVGYVGAGAEAHYYAVQGDALDRVSAPHNATRNTVAVEIRGESLGRLFDRWLAFYDKVHRPVTSDLVGRLCVVGLTDDRVLIKKIRKNRTGGYDLISSTANPSRAPTSNGPPRS
ncbi:MAG: hypothetical protein M5U08_13880 [Burkholderiales bacterium]|nr:hypothetical protein [Burkholderiales bacterium]